MSDLLKKFKGIFIVESEAEEATKPTAKQPQQPASGQQPSVAIPTPVSSGTYMPPAGKANERFTEILMNALAQHNQDGFDYFEFRESLKNLEKMPLDEKTRFQSAFAMAQTMGATPDKLTSSAQYYIDVLQNELNKFEKAHADQRMRLIGEREAESKNLEAVVQNKAEQIKQLTQEIEEANRRRDAIKQEIQQSTQKIEQTKTDFEATFAVVVGKIQADISKMKEFLK